MPKQHGKNTQVTIGGQNISKHTNSTDYGREGDSHDVTTYKENPEDTAHEFIGGLTGGTVTIAGVYDSDETTGPAAVIEPLLGTVTEFIHQPEGVGVGKPQRTMNVLVTSYQESAPVADIVSWTSDLQITGNVTKTAQTE